MWYFKINFVILLLPAIFIFLKSPQEIRKFILLFYSILFYFTFSFHFLLILIILSSITFVLAKYVNKSRILFYFSLLINFGSLCLFKFSENLIYPIGMSFYVLQSTGYLIDKRSQISPKNETQNKFCDFLLYNLFFARVLSGPIEKFDHFKKQLIELKTNPQNIITGFTIFLFGILKKIILADRMIKLYDYSLLENTEFSLSVYMIIFIIAPFIVYFDFCAYSDMAYGLSRIFGINLTHNFQSPFSAKSLPDFWKRWHVSLYLWIKEYLFSNMKKMVLVSTSSSIIIVLFCFVVSGIWHSSFGGFFWGLSVGISVVLSLVFKEKIKKFGQTFNHLLILIVVSVSTQLYFLKSFKQLKNILINLSFNDNSMSLKSYLNKSDMQFFDILLVLFLIPVFLRIDYLFFNNRELFSINNSKKSIGLVVTLLLLWYFLSFSTFKPFVYSGV